MFIQLRDSIQFDPWMWNENSEFHQKSMYYYFCTTLQQNIIVNANLWFKLESNTVFINTKPGFVGYNKGSLQTGWFVQ